MKWSVQQLRKIQTFPNHFEDKINYANLYIAIDDIISMEEVEVKGDIYRINDDTYRFVYHIYAPMRLQCALTLEPVYYLLERDYDEVYSVIDSEDVFLIEKNTIDLSEMVWANILIEKPINVTLPNAYEILKKKKIVLDDVEDLEDDEILFYSNGLNEDKE